MQDDLPQALAELLSDQEWRLNNLYHIENKGGKLVRFHMNWAQQRLHREPHNRKDVLKARQLGISTYSAILMLDMCLFAGDTAIQCAIVDKSQPDAFDKLAKIVTAYNNLDYVAEDATAEDKALATLGAFVKKNVTIDPVKGSVAFSNGCQVRAGTSKRGGTVQFLHISELGYTAIHAPQKAKEIISGSQNAVAKGQLIIRESTHEGGRYGLNYELLRKSMAKQHDKDLSPIDFRFFFFSWWEHPDYVLQGRKPNMTEEQRKYFIKLEEQHGIKLDDERKAWYCAMEASQPLGLMKQEYPSTPDEAFDTTIEGAIYGERLALAEAQGRVGRILPPDGLAPLYVAMDLGFSDLTTMWLMQPRDDGFYYALDYFAAGSETLEFYVDKIRRWEREFGQLVHCVFLPHDAQKRSIASGIAYVDEFKKSRLPFKVLKRINDVFLGIRFTRKLINQTIFSEACERPCTESAVPSPSGLSCLRSYRTRPMSPNGGMAEEPLHDINSHGADAFRYFAEALEAGYVGKAGNVGKLEEPRGPMVATRSLPW